MNKINYTAPIVNQTDSSVKVFWKEYFSTSQTRYTRAPKANDANQYEVDQLTKTKKYFWQATLLKVALSLTLIIPLAAGIYKLIEMYNLKNYNFVLIKSLTESKTAEKVHELKSINLNPSNINVIIADEVKVILDQLFEGSSYSLDKLPVYPVIIKNEDKLPKKEIMKFPVMKGSIDDGRVFIAIKMNYKLTTHDIEQLDSVFGKHYKNNQKLTQVLLLCNDIKSPRMWSQLDTTSVFQPAFFSWNFTFTDGSGPTETQKNNFELVKSLLQTGEGNDTKGRTWKLEK